MTNKKWYFSTDGEVTGPMNLEDAQRYAQANPDIYGWHPSFKQWKPVTLISELGNITSQATPSIHQLTELVEKFKIKKQRLDKKLSVIEQRIEVNESLLSTLNNEISLYKELTANLSDGVKSAINIIEKQYLSLQEKQSRLNEAASISMMEIETLVNDFNARIADKTGINVSDKESIEHQLHNEVVNAQVNDRVIHVVNAEHEEIIDVDAIPVEENRPRKVKLVEVNALQKEAEQDNETRGIDDEIIDSEQDQSQDDNNAFTGMKSLIKSVFKNDEGSSSGPVQEDSLSKLLAMEEAEKEEEISPSIAFDEDQDNKVKRRTRRRR